MKTYEVLINGIPHTVQLDEPPTEKAGSVGTEKLDKAATSEDAGGSTGNKAKKPADK